MPKHTPTSSNPNTPLKPYSRQAPSDTSSPKNTSKAWTGDEYVRMFELAVGHVGQKTFEGGIGDRTPKQCADIWKKIVEPFINKALKEKGKGKSGV